MVMTALLGFFVFIQIGTGLIRASYQKKVDRVCTKRLFEHVFRLPWRQVQARSVGDLIVRIMGLERIRNYVLNDFVYLVVSGVVLLPVLVFMTFINAVYALILVSFIICALLFNFVFGLRLHKLALVENYDLSDHRGLLNEFLKEHYFIKASGIFRPVRDKWARAFDRYLDSATARIRQQYTVDAVNGSLAMMSVMLFLVIGFMDYNNNQEKIIQCVLFYRHVQHHFYTGGQDCFKHHQLEHGPSYAVKDFRHLGRNAGRRSSGGGEAVQRWRHLVSGCQFPV